MLNPNPKKILYLRTDIYNKPLIGGGSVTHTLGVINGFLSLGYTVVSASSSMHEHLKNLSLEELIILANPIIFGWLRWKINCLLSNIFFTVQVLSLYKKHKPDFLYQRYSILNFVGILVSKITGVPLILEYNGSETWVQEQWSKGGSKFKLIWLIDYVERINISHADYLVVVSEALQEELVVRGVQKTKILVNPNGVDTEVCNPQKYEDQRHSIRTQLHINEKFVVGFIGTFSIWHGINVLQELITSCPDIYFLLIGDGPLLKPLQDAILKSGTNNTFFTGMIAPSQAHRYLAACDAFVCPTQPNPDGTRFFGSPTKVFEYLSFAKPTIASNLEQLKELFLPALTLGMLENCTKITQEVGILVAPTSNDFLIATRALVKLSILEKNKIGNNARKHVLENYTWKKHVERIVKFVAR